VTPIVRFRHLQANPCYTLLPFVALLTFDCFRARLAFSPRADYPAIGRAPVNMIASIEHKDIHTAPPASMHGTQDPRTAQAIDIEELRKLIPVIQRRLEAGHEPGDVGLGRDVRAVRHSPPRYRAVLASAAIRRIVSAGRRLVGAKRRHLACAR